MAEQVPCPFAVEEGASCMDTVELPGRVRNTFRSTPDELSEEVVDSLLAYEVTTCDLCDEQYTVEYYPE
jgi:hypothetical protein